MSLSIVNDPLREWSQKFFERFESGTPPAAPRPLLEEIPSSRPRFVIWTGAANETSMFSALGLLKGGPRQYVLDTPDPAKLKAVFDDMQRLTGEQLPALLPATLVAGDASDPNVEPIASVYRKFELEPRFTEVKETGLYSLALASVELSDSDEDSSPAWKLAAFLHSQAMDGRDKVSLLMPKSLAAAARWTKRIFEAASLDIHLVIDEKVRLRSFRRVGEKHQDRAFLAIQRKGEAHPEAKEITELRHAHYPMAIVTFGSKPVLKYMSFMRRVVAGIAWLSEKGSSETPTSEPHEPVEWASLKRPDARKLAYDLKKLAAAREFEYGEFRYFGDMRHAEEGRAMRVLLERAADRIFRSRLKMPCDIEEGSGGGRGKPFTILLMAARPTHFALAHYEPDAYIAQLMALRAGRKGPVPAIPVDGLEDLDSYFQEVASLL